MFIYIYLVRCVCDFLFMGQFHANFFFVKYFLDHFDMEKMVWNIQQWFTTLMVCGPRSSIKYLGLSRTLYHLYVIRVVYNIINHKFRFNLQIINFVTLGFCHIMAKLLSEGFLRGFWITAPWPPRWVKGRVKEPWYRTTKLKRLLVSFCYYFL